MAAVQAANSNCWPIVGLLVQLAIIGLGLAMMLQILTPEDALKRIAGLLLLVIALEFLVKLLGLLWQGMTLWERAVLVVIGILFAARALRGTT